nr:hypothetical protein [Tanacetum cinerariifolium]
HETHISQQGGSGTDEGTGSKPRVLDVPSNDSDEEISWNSSDDEDDDQTKGSDDKEGLRISEEERMHEEEEADELYRDVDINQGRRLQVSQETEDSHMILTPTHSDGQQESSSTSSFVTYLLNPTIDPGMESIFTTGSSTQMLEAVREAVQIHIDRLQDSIQRENDEFLKTIDDNMKKIIKEQVKTQVKVQVTRILPRIEESMNT